MALDTEFHTERSYRAHLMVVQLALPDPADPTSVGRVALVDPLAVQDLAPLAHALRGVTVVGHALSSDLKIFADTFGELPANVFDTQLAAAFVGYGLSISLLDLVRELARVQLRKSQTVSDWSTRPLTPRQIDYLVDDVRYLFTLQDQLEERLLQRGRLEWAREECRLLADIGRYRTDEDRLWTRVPGNARLNRRELGILREVAKARDAIAGERNVPLKYVIPDDAMLGIVQLRPKSVDDLSQLRRLDNGMRKHYGAAIVAAVARGEATPDEDLPHKPARTLTPPRETLVSTMNVVVNAIASDNDLPPTLLAPRAALERIARELPASHEAFVATLDLSPWRTELVGEPLWRFVTGGEPLRIVGYAEGVPRTVVGEP